MEKRTNLQSALPNLTNPFLTQFQPPKAWKNETYKSADRLDFIDAQGVIEAGTKAFVKRSIKDTESFVKLYLEGANALQKVNGAGVKVFCILFAQMRANVGRKDLHLSLKVAEAHGIKMSKTTFHNGLNELYQKRFIDKGPYPGVYWINPKYLWAGDRIALVELFQLNEKRCEPPTIELKALDPKQIDIEEAINAAKERD